MMNEEELRQLYCDRQLSMMQIAEKLHVTHAAVLYWLKKYRISRRSWSESAYAKQNPSGDPFVIPAQLTFRQRELMIAGLLLYWAEGSKTQSSTRIANLDERMLQLFAKFLRQVCCVEESRLSVYVRLHEQFDLMAAKEHWSQALSLSSSQVFVYPHRDRRSKVDKQWSRYGLATLEFHNTKFKQWLRGAIEKFIEQQLETVDCERRSPSAPSRPQIRHGGDDFSSAAISNVRVPVLLP